MRDEEIFPRAEAEAHSSPGSNDLTSLELILSAGSSPLHLKIRILASMGAEIYPEPCSNIFCSILTELSASLSPHRTRSDLSPPLLFLLSNQIAFSFQVFNSGLKELPLNGLKSHKEDRSASKFNPTTTFSSLPPFPSPLLPRHLGPAPLSHSLSSTHINFTFLLQAGLTLLHFYRSLTMLSVPTLFVGLLALPFLTSAAPIPIATLKGRDFQPRATACFIPGSVALPAEVQASVAPLLAAPVTC